MTHAQRPVLFMSAVCGRGPTGANAALQAVYDARTCLGSGVNFENGKVMVQSCLGRNQSATRYVERQSDSGAGKGAAFAQYDYAALAGDVAFHQILGNHMSVRYCWLWMGWMPGILGCLGPKKATPPAH